MKKILILLFVLPLFAKAQVPTLNPDTTYADKGHKTGVLLVTDAAYFQKLANPDLTSFATFDKYGKLIKRKVTDAISIKFIYDENTEWVTSATVSGINFNDTSKPFNNKKDISLTLNNNITGNVSFRNSSALNIISFTSLSLFINRVDVVVSPPSTFNVAYTLGGKVVSNYVPVNSLVGYDDNLNSIYQQVSIASSKFTFTNEGDFDGVIFSFNNFPASFIDYITLQEGDASPYLTNVFRKVGSDSVFKVINGVNKFAYKDSIGSVSGGGAYTGTSPINVLGNVISITDATSTTNGALSATAQTIGGIKTFNNDANFNGKVKIADGTQGAGKVWVSDINGTGSWSTPSAPGTVYTGTAPVIVTGSNISLDTSKVQGNVATFNDILINKTTLTAGTNITITGTHPNYTIGSSLTPRYQVTAVPFANASGILTSDSTKLSYFGEYLSIGTTSATGQSGILLNQGRGEVSAQFSGMYFNVGSGKAAGGVYDASKGYTWQNRGNTIMTIRTSAITGGTNTLAFTGDATTTGTITSAQPIKAGGYTVATLPTAGIVGRVAYVTDATAPTYLGALTGGGTVKCPVFDNGTIWVSN